ncbi:MAG: hypothetical protein MI976_21945 [Pseudomonadales bacterium]|nr:hypothetical protein [Pseudomonadales bacterium]
MPITRKRYGLHAQFMTLLVIVFLLLTVFAGSVLQLRIKQLQQLEFENQLLGHAEQLISISRQLHKGLFTRTQANASELQAIKKGLHDLKLFVTDNDTEWQQLTASTPFNNEAIDQLIAALPNTQHDLLANIVKSCEESLQKAFNILIAEDPRPELYLLNRLLQLQETLQAQNESIEISRRNGVSLEVLLQLIDISKKEKHITGLINNHPKSNLTLPSDTDTVANINRLIVKNQILSDLNKQLGYDGAIHSFKNLVLRGPENYEEKTQLKLLAAIRSIDALSAQYSLSTASRLDIIALQRVLVSYADKVEIVVTMWERQQNIAVIDQAVKVDDTLAAQALNRLQSDIYTTELSALYDKLFEKVSHTLRAMDTLFSALKSQVHKEHAHQKREIWAFVAVLVAGCILLFVSAVVFLRRLLRRVLEIQDVLNYVETHEDLNIAAPENGDDEIADIAKALNKAIKHRREIQQKLQQEKEKASQASQAKTAFLAGMSHEMRTPLNAVIGFSHRLLAKHTDTQSREFEALNTINQNGKRLLDRVSHILRLVEVESEEHMLNESTGIQRLQQALHSQIECFTSGSMTLDWSITDMDINLIGPTNWILDIIGHLCADENFPDDSKISIKVSRQKQSSVDINLSYRDAQAHGDTINHLFEVGIGLINPNSQAHEGSNLNFAILKALVEKLGGKLKANFDSKNLRVQYFISLPLF